MKKEKVLYLIQRYEGMPVQAKKELPYEIQLQARLILDEICFNYNKKILKSAIDQALKEGNRKNFKTYSETYRQFVWE